jgi:hypothetical protein
MLWAQIAILILLGASLLIYSNEHGKVIEKKGNFWSGFVSILISTTLFYFAGAFDQIFK